LGSGGLDICDFLYQYLTPTVRAGA